jgi:hypothetical protein
VKALQSRQEALMISSLETIGQRKLDKQDTLSPKDSFEERQKGSFVDQSTESWHVFVQPR